MKELSKDWTEPLSLIAVDGSGKNSMWVNKADIYMKYKKEVKKTRNFYWYLCKDPKDPKVPWKNDGVGRSNEIEPKSIPPSRNCKVDKYLNC